MTGWSSTHWECLMQERSEVPDSTARKPRKRAAAKRPKVTPELLAQYTNAENAELTAAEAPAFTKLPPVRELTPADKLRTRIAADPSLHGQWFIPALYAKNLPRHIAQNIAASWRRAKPETFGSATGARFQAGADLSTEEPGTWVIKVMYDPNSTTHAAADA